MTYIFKNLNSRTATFEDFRKEYLEQFGVDFFEGTDKEDIPTGLIRNSNNGFIHAYAKSEYVELWVDDGNFRAVIIG